jgi:hypothetical protein
MFPGCNQAPTKTAELLYAQTSAQPSQAAQGRVGYCVERTMDTVRPVAGCSLPGLAWFSRTMPDLALPAACNGAHTIPDWARPSNTGGEARPVWATPSNNTCGAKAMPDLEMPSPYGTTGPGCATLSRPDGAHTRLVLAMPSITDGALRPVALWGKPSASARPGQHGGTCSACGHQLATSVACGALRVHPDPEASTSLDQGMNFEYQHTGNPSLRIPVQSRTFSPGKAPPSLGVQPHGEPCNASSHILSPTLRRVLREARLVSQSAHAVRTWTRSGSKDSTLEPSTVGVTLHSASTGAQQGWAHQTREMPAAASRKEGAASHSFDQGLVCAKAEFRGTSCPLGHQYPCPVQLASTRHGHDTRSQGRVRLRSTHFKAQGNRASGRKWAGSLTSPSPSRKRLRRSGQDLAYPYCKGSCKGNTCGCHARQWGSRQPEAPPDATHVPPTCHPRAPPPEATHARQWGSRQPEAPPEATHVTSLAAHEALGKRAGQAGATCPPSGAQDCLGEADAALSSKRTPDIEARGPRCRSLNVRDSSQTSQPARATSVHSHSNRDPARHARRIPWPAKASPAKKRSVRVRGKPHVSSGDVAARSETSVPPPCTAHSSASLGPDIKVYPRKFSSADDSAPERSTGTDLRREPVHRRTSPARGQKWYTAEPDEAAHASFLCEKGSRHDGIGEDDLDSQQQPSDCRYPSSPSTLGGGNEMLYLVQCPVSAALRAEFGRNLCSTRQRCCCVHFAQQECEHNITCMADFQGATEGGYQHRCMCNDVCVAKEQCMCSASCLPICTSAGHPADQVGSPGPEVPKYLPRFNIAGDDLQESCRENADTPSKPTVFALHEFLEVNPRRQESAGRSAGGVYQCAASFVSSLVRVRCKWGTVCLLRQSADIFDFHFGLFRC